MIIFPVWEANKGYLFSFFTKHFSFFGGGMRMTLSIMKRSIITLSIMTLSIMTLSIMTLSIMTLRIIASKLQQCLSECCNLVMHASVIVLGFVMLCVITPYVVMLIDQMLSIVILRMSVIM